MNKSKFLSLLLYIKSYIDSLMPTKANKTDVELYIEKTRLSIGADKKLNVEFKGTNHLDDCKSIVEAIIKLDSLLPKV